MSSAAGTSGAGAAPSSSQSAKPPSGAHHTIALVQPSKHDSTRFYRDYSSITDCVESFLHMYETRLREYNPGSATITYDYNSLCQFLDDMKEVCVLSWDSSIQGYKRYDKAWTKAALQDHLANMAQPGAGNSGSNSGRGGR